MVVPEIPVENPSDGATVLPPRHPSPGAFGTSVHKTANMSDLTTGHRNECHS